MYWRLKLSCHGILKKGHNENDKWPNLVTPQVVLLLHKDK